MGCCPTGPYTRPVESIKRPRPHHKRMATDGNSNQRRVSPSDEPTDDEQVDMYSMCYDNDDEINGKPDKGTPFDAIINAYRNPAQMDDMIAIKKENIVFMIEPFKYDESHPDNEPRPIRFGSQYNDRGDSHNLSMPCSLNNVSRDRKPIWPIICGWINHLKEKCDKQEATFEDLQKTIDTCTGVHHDLDCLRELLSHNYLPDERTRFMCTTLSRMCDLVLNLNKVFTQPPPLLRTHMDGAVTMSQQQAASLLACSFFCLFPNRTQWKGYENYQNPNFDTLYTRGPKEKVEKLRCVLHYFLRVTEKMPMGVITFKRYVLKPKNYPNWPELKTELCTLHLTTSKRIEDIQNTLQVDFANEYIGGGVLGNGCVQEEIRFSICPEMLVSLLLCEKMEKNECIFLIGCERFSSYKGYAHTFKFDRDYLDETPKDNWGRKWCHVVAMDAIYFRNPSSQFQKKNVERELLKAYTSFLPQGKSSDYRFGIATGNWGCGAFNGDRQLKAIIQLMAASYAQRPLIYAAFGDKKLAQSFCDIYNEMKIHHTTVADLFHYLLKYADRFDKSTLFEFILTKLKSS
ncbi:hypothetical protein I4U23_029321 [Adineta vaga]|nr:hypothetical protein I4U23_029321 [Adineta vaga]